MNDECEPLLRYCTDMGEWTTEDSFGEKVVDFKTVLEIETLTLIKDKYLDPIETELKGFISEAVRDATPSNFLRWFADARLETGAGASDADTRLQLAHLRNNSPDSKILGVALFPLLQALTNFSRITLAVFESRSTTGELTAHFTDKWLTPSFRNLLAGASTPATAKRWLFAQRLRAEVHDCFARFFATLNALGWQDLIRAAFRCGMACVPLQRTHMRARARTDACAADTICTTHALLLCAATSISRPPCATRSPRVVAATAWTAP